MSFPENTSPNSVQFLKGGGVDIIDDDVEEEAKVLEALEPSVDEVESSDGKKSFTSALREWSSSVAWTGETGGILDPLLAILTMFS